MAEQKERFLWVARGHVLAPANMLKGISSLGLYTFVWLSRELIVTDRRVIWRTGVFSKQERAVPLQRVQDITISQSILGRMLGYGDLRIETAGSSQTEIVMLAVASPGKVRDSIFTQLPQAQQAATDVPRSLPSRR